MIAGQRHVVMPEALHKATKDMVSLAALSALYCVVIGSVLLCITVQMMVTAVHALT